MYRLQIGELISIIRILDVNNQVFNKKAIKVIDNYPSIRNKFIGHGYTHADKIDEIAEQLENLYSDLINNVQILKNEYSIICVLKIVDNQYKGERFSTIDGIPEKWSCPLNAYSYDNDYLKKDTLELFGLFIAYSADSLISEIINIREEFSLGNISGTNFKIRYKKILKLLYNEYNNKNIKLFKFVQNKKLNQFPPKVNHNFQMALLQTIKLCNELGKVNISYLKRVEEICAFALENFYSHYHSGLKRTQASIDTILSAINTAKRIPQKNYNIDDIVDGYISRVKDYGVFVILDSNSSGLIHISNISNNFVECIYNEFKVGDKVKVKVDNIDMQKKISLKLVEKEKNAYDKLF